MATIGLGIILIETLCALSAPVISPKDPFEQDLTKKILPPRTGGHILGTDELGRDRWSRLIHGARVVLIILPVSENLSLPGGTAIWGVFAALIFGTTLGLVGGYYGGWIDEIVMRLLDAMTER